MGRSFQQGTFARARTSSWGLQATVWYRAGVGRGGRILVDRRSRGGRRGRVVPVAAGNKSRTDRQTYQPSLSHVLHSTELRERQSTCARPAPVARLRLHMRIPSEKASEREGSGTLDFPKQ
jgi:hypothetical protein